MIVNPVFRGLAARAAIDAIIRPDETAIAGTSITRWPGYAPTRLADLPARAKVSGIARLGYKDEGNRFGLKSFKALGGAFAVQRHLQQAIGAEADLDALLAGRLADRTRPLTVTCATDGNHGRAVAWGARLFGCRAVIYIHETVSAGRERAIAGYGAEVVRVPGVYEDAVRRCAADAADRGWAVISDTAYPGCMDVPRTVMAGYTVMTGEALDQWGAEQWGAGPPSHVFIQAGVGGLAAAVAASLLGRYGAAMPRLVVVEPEAADCCYQSARAGRPMPASGTLDTICAGLACGEPSLLAWDVLADLAHAFMTVSDRAVVDEMRRLARPEAGDPAIVAGESAAAGLAGMTACLGDPALAAKIGLDGSSRVLVFGSEADTDPDLYQKLIHPTPDWPT
jgi:diaminopropionate ammonia-lyase